MNPLLDVLATAGGSIGLAAFFLWLLTTAARQESDGPHPHVTAGDRRPLGLEIGRTGRKGGRAHG